MKEVVIVGESYFDREFIQILIKKYCGETFYFHLSDHTNKSSVLKDFQKYKNWAINIKKTV